jgi:hypothetical protein
MTIPAAMSTIFRRIANSLNFLSMAASSQRIPAFPEKSFIELYGIFAEFHEAWGIRLLAENEVSQTIGNDPDRPQFRDNPRMVDYS